MNELIDKINNNYILNHYDILRIARAFINENNLSFILNDVIPDDTIDYIASYDLANRIIRINYDEVNKYVNDWSNSLLTMYKIDYKYYNYFINFYYLYIIFHELTHVIQRKNHDFITRDINDLYLFLYELSNYILSTDSELYNNYHSIIPTEIEANNNGLLKSYNFMSHTNLPNKEKRVMHIQYLYSLLNNYEKVSRRKIISPINKLYNTNQRINIDMINNMLQESNLSKIERLNLGLSITPREFNSLQKEKYRLLIKR